MVTLQKELAIASELDLIEGMLAPKQTGEIEPQFPKRRCGPRDL